MEKSESLSLIEELGGDEHAWVDFKEDYEIGGIPRDKAEFIRDIASLANTITQRESHYIIVGVDDDGDLLGITEGREDYRGAGPRHIFSYDEADIQQIIDSNLMPSPKLAWYTYEEDSKKFGILEISPLESPPCVTSQHIDEDDDRHLHKGVIYLRKGSSKKIAEREDIEEIIEHRIQQQREQILDGVHKAIEVGPEWIERIGDALPDEDGVPLATTTDPEDADIEISERLTREPASSLDSQLNEDISQWMHRGDDYIEQLPLWQYYANPGALNLDKTALLFLTQSAIKNQPFGAFWLLQSNPDERRDILLSTPDKFHRIKQAGSLMLILDDEEGFDKLLEKSRTNVEYGHLKECKSKFGTSIHNRANFLLKNEDGEYSLKHDGWRKDIRPKNLDEDDIERILPKCGRHLEDLYEIYSTHREYGNRLEEFSDALWDLEVVYAACVNEGYN